MRKGLDLEHLTSIHDPDVIALTETWLHNGVFDSEFTPPQFCAHRRDRNSRGGGVALLFRKGLKVVRLSEPPGAEAMFCKLFFENECLVIGVVYRPPGEDVKVLEELKAFIASLISQNTKLILCGDFNLPGIDWNTFSATNNDIVCGEELIDIAFRFDLRQIVKDCTRVHGESKSILDLVFVRSNIPGTIECDVVDGISDHHAVLVQFPSLKATKHVKVISFHDFARADDVSILEMLESSYDDFFRSVHTCDVNALWVKFRNMVHACIQLFVPLRTKKTNVSNPWITRDIIHLKRKVKRLKKAKKKLHHNTNIHNQILSVSKELKIKMREEKHNFYNVRLSKMIKESPASFWRFIKPVISNCDTFIVNNASTTDATVIASEFNDYFKSVFVTDDGSSPFYKKFSDLPPIENLDVSESGVLNLLLDLNIKKSPGPDEIPNAFLKRYALWCAKYLTLIYNLSLSTGLLPDDWKTSIVKPLHKQGDKHLIANYRPIALTCTCCKLLEHVIYKHVMKFLEANSVLSPAQHGFRHGFSTVTQLVEVIHDFASAINNHTQIDAIFLDFTKAFDKLSHPKLLLKVSHILKNSTICNWIESYLTSRKQCVSFNQATSTMLPVSSGVPQGSVLGPLLFLLYINDIADNCNVKIRLYADDCVIYSVINSINDQLQLNRELHQLFQWCNTWQMSVNLKKSVVMSIANKTHIHSFDYTIDGTILSRVEHYKYLGLHIRSDLRWNDHITEITNKGMSKLHYLKRSLRHSSCDTKLIAFKTLVLPILEYANIVWDPFTQSNINKLERVQNKAVRFIFNRYDRVSVSGLVAKANLKHTSARNKIARLRFMFKIVKGHLNGSISNYVHFSTGYDTRMRHCFSITPYQTANNVFKYSFFPRTIEEWNALDAPTVEANSVEMFDSLLAG